MHKMKSASKLLIPPLQLDQVVTGECVARFICIAKFFDGFVCYSSQHLPQIYSPSSRQLPEARPPQFVNKDVPFCDENPLSSSNIIIEKL